MKENKEMNWKIKFAIIMFVLAVLIFLARYLICGDGEEIIAYLWKHIGFIPIDILIVALVLEEIMGRKEHEAILEKIDMLMGTFFSEIGNDLIAELSKANVNKANTDDLKAIKSWNDKDYDNKLKELKNNPVDFKANIAPEEREDFLNRIQSLLVENREFLVNLINNPNLLEKDEFSSLLLALLHLDEELARRGELTDIKDADFNHLNGDMKRVYSKLVYEWVYYLKYLNKHYPYMISLAIRTNPFDSEADVHVTE
ncbi:hypothetical protein mru_1206 [Methanobrevibacter ruminantium M1]|uniref:Uncharacterized protein n=1 Tax=Methanobrevibacter ruminantium (strain ATCC 35063 / DSM 1093 / JCM 13430 / OCM 146 / M1) TaxID=634498 RepID=D3E3E5_METRM|nr:hypothetical protein [Methanobrevibacter ruminantium]ADC47056.1 hypothetical protein mru_1206 [Methanobrevibacter ruminantium M1]